MNHQLNRTAWAFAACGIFLISIFSISRVLRNQPSEPARPTAGSEADVSPFGDGIAMGANQALVEEGEAFLEGDAPPFYSTAARFFEKAHSLSHQGQLLGRAADAEAETLPYSERPDVVAERVERLVAEGRRAEPTLGVFPAVMAKLALYQGDVKGAARSLEAAQRLWGTGESRDLILEGQLLQALGREHDARLKFEECLRLHPSSARARFQLAALAFHQGDLQTARGDLMENIELNPFHAKSFFLLALILEREKAFVEADRFFLSAERLSAFGPPLLSRLARSRVGVVPLLSEREVEQRAKTLISSGEIAKARLALRAGLRCGGTRPVWANGASSWRGWLGPSRT